jgi:hypothetical protein
MVRLKKPIQKDQPKRPKQNGWVQIDLSKMAHWSSWTWGNFFTKILGQESRDFL